VGVGAGVAVGEREEVGLTETKRPGETTEIFLSII
jgi:hypothetical protein